jgi:hypothetical protein
VQRLILYTGVFLNGEPRYGFTAGPKVRWRETAKRKTKFHKIALFENSSF